MKKSDLNGCEAAELKTLIGQLSWVSTQTRPDIAFDVLDLSTSKATVETALKANKTVDKLFKFNYSIKYPVCQSLKDASMVIYSDASLANLNDGFSSGAGFIIFISCGTFQFPLYWRSFKIKRVVRSTIAAETMALVEAIDNGLYFCSMLFEITGQKLPIDCYVDNKSLCENIHSTKSVDEKRLRLDIAAIREFLDNNSIRAVHWVPTSRQISDCFTKRGSNCQKLVSSLECGELVDELS